MYKLTNNDNFLFIYMLIKSRWVSHDPGFYDIQRGSSNYQILHSNTSHQNKHKDPNFPIQLSPNLSLLLSYTNFSNSWHHHRRLQDNLKVAWEKEKLNLKPKKFYEDEESDLSF